VEILVPEKKTVPVRTVIATLETESGVAESSKPAMPAPAPAEVPPPAVAPDPSNVRRPSGERFYSPLVLTVAREEGVSLSELEMIPGSGEGGRVSKKDILSYVEARKSRPASPVHPTPAIRTTPGAMVGIPIDDPDLRRKYPPPAYEILQMSNVVQKMAQHMVQSVQTSPHVAAIHEVDMTVIARHRTQHAAGFEQREGFKLTYTPYIAIAAIKALKKYPLLNSSVEGDKIIKKNFINLGLAVASESGLIVPVVKHAEEKNFVGMARAVNDLAVRTRSKKLTPEDIQGGTFTISNFGVFGTMIGIPIINQPQVAILGTGAITKRPVVTDEDAIAIRSIAYFTLSIDHRIIDGAMGGMFLEEIVRNLEGFDATIRF
jgi:pyruvate/2-oxoglutarate dehydrogenase complex dihydrolipoamide acyltransferase (E2) component